MRASSILPAQEPITPTINGPERKLEVAPRTTLLDLRRGYLDLTGTKKGCDHGKASAKLKFTSDGKSNRSESESLPLLRPAC